MGWCSTPTLCVPGRPPKPESPREVSWGARVQPLGALVMRVVPRPGVEAGAQKHLLLREEGPL